MRPITAEGPATPAVWGLIVTYERPAELLAMLGAVMAQTRPPDRMLVVDNGSRHRAEDVVRSFGSDYVGTQANLGPAGGIATGMEQILREAADDDWIMLFDDDDPPPFDDVIEELLVFGSSMVERDEQTAGVGALGAVYDRRRGIFRRLPDGGLRGAVSVDVIHGGRFPLYRCGVLRASGVFDAELFFGFEEGDFGLRLRKEGYSLYLHGAMAIRLREELGELNRPNPQRTALDKAAWRRYYGVRNSTLLAKRYARRWTPPVIAAGGAIKGAIALTRSRRPLREVLLPFAGAVAGLRGRTGRTINPPTSTK